MTLDLDFAPSCFSIHSFKLELSGRSKAHHPALAFAEKRPLISCNLNSSGVLFRANAAWIPFGRPHFDRRSSRWGPIRTFHRNRRHIRKFGFCMYIGQVGR